MFRLSGRFDPLSGVVVHGHLQAMLAALFAERVPSTCPTDPGAKQDHLRALALLALIMQQQSVGLTVVPNEPEGSSDSSFDERHGDGDTGAKGTRLASRAQRRALRALYPTCAVPGCCVAFEFTKPHHVHYWEHGGPTNLANLLPVCSKHHHAIHEGGWKLTLQPNRHLKISLPDGTALTTGPPLRLQAA